MDRVIVVWLDTLEDELDVVVVYDKSIEDCLSECAEPYRGSYRLGRGAMTFRSRPRNARAFDVGDVVDTHQDGYVLIRRHASGSFTAIVNGQPVPARQYLLAMRDALGLPDKTTNTTRSLGAQVFGKLRE